MEEHEDDDLARDMFKTASARYGASHEVVHSDGCPLMSSDTLTGLFHELGVEVSRKRPRVSTDNPYSESALKSHQRRVQTMAACTPSNPNASVSLPSSRPPWPTWPSTTKSATTHSR